MISSEAERGQQERKIVRGAPYSLEQFQQKYELGDKEAHRLFSKFGPSSIDLDAFMAARDRQKLVRDFLQM